jgi:hypothetical protein
MHIRKLSWRSIEVVESIEAGLNAARRGRVARTVLHEGRMVLVPAPIRVSGASATSEKFGQRLLSNRRYWAGSVDAMFFPELLYVVNHGLLIPKGEQICDETIYSLKPSFKNSALEDDGAGYKLTEWFARAGEDVESLPGVTWLLHPRWHSNYTHWHVEGLSQLSCLPLLQEKISRIAIPDDLSFQRDSLSLSGNIRTEVVGVPPPVAKYDLAVFLTHNLFRTLPHPAIAEFLQSWREGCVKSLGISADPKEKRPTYLARLDSRFRPMENERELCSALEARGFRIVVASEHSYAEQIRIFAQASILVSPHGSGLTNSIFTEPGTPIVELRSTNAGARSPFVDRSYSNLAAIIDRPYAGLFYDSDPDASNWRCDVSHATDQTMRLVDETQKN